MKEFLSMGGYAFYVWTSYGLALFILVANFVSPLLQRYKLLEEFARRARRARRQS